MAGCRRVGLGAEGGRLAVAGLGWVWRVGGRLEQPGGGWEAGCSRVGLGKVGDWL